MHTPEGLSTYCASPSVPRQNPNFCSGLGSLEFLVGGLSSWPLLPSIQQDLVQNALGR